MYAFVGTIASLLFFFCQTGAGSIKSTIFAECRTGIRAAPARPVDFVPVAVYRRTAKRIPHGRGPQRREDLKWMDAADEAPDRASVLYRRSCFPGMTRSCPLPGREPPRVAPPAPFPLITEERPHALSATIRSLRAPVHAPPPPRGRHAAAPRPRAPRRRPVQRHLHAGRRGRLGRSRRPDGPECRRRLPGHRHRRPHRPRPGQHAARRLPARLALRRDGCLRPLGRRRSRPARDRRE